jgi:hypothetical protein
MNENKILDKVGQFSRAFHSNIGWERGLAADDPLAAGVVFDVQQGCWRPPDKGHLNADDPLA